VADELRPVLLPLDVACACGGCGGAFICEQCSRVVPWCFGGDDDELCDDCHVGGDDDGEDDDDDQGDEDEDE
jgi:hypothetical protein